LDLLTVSLAYLFAQWIRFQFSDSPLATDAFIARYLLTVSAFGMGFLVFQSHAGVMRHSGTEDFLRLFKATLLGFGLVELPRLLWRRSFPESRLKWHYHRVSVWRMGLHIWTAFFSQRTCMCVCECGGAW
jgi:hypothetical protein